MRHTDRNRLLDEIVDSGDLSAFRRASLERGTVFLQRRRRIRRLTRACAVAVIPLLLVAALFFAGSRDRFRTNTVPSLNGSDSHRGDLPEIKFIGDDELFALFPDRPAALIGSPGHQRFVFLDTLAASRQQ